MAIVDGMGDVVGVVRVDAVVVEVSPTGHKLSRGPGNAEAIPNKVHESKIRKPATAVDDAIFPRIFNRL